MEFQIRKYFVLIFKTSLRSFNNIYPPIMPKAISNFLLAELHYSFSTMFVFGPQNTNPLNFSIDEINSQNQNCVQKYIYGFLKGQYIYNHLFQKYIFKHIFKDQEVHIISLLNIYY